MLPSSAPETSTRESAVISKQVIIPSCDLKVVRLYFDTLGFLKSHSFILVSSPPDAKYLVFLSKQKALGAVI